MIGAGSWGTALAVVLNKNGHGAVRIGSAAYHQRGKRH